MRHEDTRLMPMLFFGKQEYPAREYPCYVGWSAWRNDNMTHFLDVDSGTFFDARQLNELRRMDGSELTVDWVQINYFNRYTKNPENFKINFENNMLCYA